MKAIKKDDKKYKLVNIGRNRTMWIEVKPNKLIIFIKSLFK